MGEGPVLIVEDDPTVRSILLEALESAGYRTVTVTNGADGIAAVDLLQPQLVLLDLNMPVLDGRSVADELRRRGQAVPLLLLSASPDIWRVADDIGAAGYVPKPFDVGALLGAIAMLTSAPPATGGFSRASA